MTQTSFPKKEKEILAFWKEKKIFEQTLTQNAPKGDFVFYDGPPFATGLPHYGHIIAGTIKDVIPRYKTMHGLRVTRRWGWDCHGLPIENLIEQEKGFKENKEIERDIAGFNQACRDSVLRYRDEWKKSVDRTGRWVDMENDYRTMDNRYIEVIWWIFKELWKEGLIYEGYKSMHLCPRCETTLSNFEVTLGYEEVKDLAVYVKFSIFNFQFSNKFQISNDAKVYMLAWTTTGWTLPGNMALAVGADIDYGLIQVTKSTASAIQEGDVYIIAVKSVQGMMRGSEGVRVHQQNIPENVKKWGGEYYKIVEKGNTDDRSKPYKPPTRRTWSPDLSKADVHGTILINDQEQVWWSKIGIVKGSDLVGFAYEPLFGSSVEQVKNDPNFKNAFKVYAADFVNTEEGTGIVHIAPAFGEDDHQLSLKENLPFLQHVNHDGTFKEYVSFAPGKKVKTKEDPTGADVEVIKYLAAHNALFKKEKYAHSYPHCWRCDTPLINYAASSWFVKVTALKERLLEANSKVNWMPEHIKNGRFGKWLEGARDWAISRSRYWGAPLPVWRCESCKEIKVVGSVAELAQNKTPEDLHRPYIDEIVLSCDKCGGAMRRIKEVFDCWFESGSMPYASELIYSDYKITPHTTRDDLKKHIAFPADFIAEGTDQTRGWFYTLMVLGVALYGESPFKNVIVNGIILAEDGQKMSKRLKNYPDPQVIMDKYGADAMRFYLMSSPAVRADSLNFSEKGVDEVYKKVILLTLNVVNFWKMYVAQKLVLGIHPSKHILDEWIMARTNQLNRVVSSSFDNYEIDKACRPIVEFIDDLSTWYIRRSRERFKIESEDKIYALQTLKAVLQTFAKIIAPIMPFLGEYIHREIGMDSNSVHEMAWPHAENFNESVLSEMAGVRTIIEEGHRLRDIAHIKVRQPLSKIVISDTVMPRDVYVPLIKDELNVRAVESVENLPNGDEWVMGEKCSLMITMSEDLKEEGLVREFTRHINHLRNKEGWTINESADSLNLDSTDAPVLGEVIRRYQSGICERVLVNKIVASDSDDSFHEIEVNENKLYVKLIRIR